MAGKVHHSENDKVEHKTNRSAGFALTRATRYVLAAGLAVIVVMFTLRLTQNYPAWLLLRQAERERSQLHWLAAESLYNRAWNLDSSNFVVAEALGDLYSARATWNTQRRVEYTQSAIRWYERAFGINRYDNDALIKTARLYDSLGQRDEAEKLYTSAVQADDLNSAYHTQLGLHYQRWRDSENAAASFQHAQQLGAPDPLPDIQLKRLGKSSGS